jgi:hypothetical protein
MAFFNQRNLACFAIFLMKHCSRQHQAGIGTERKTEEAYPSAIDGCFVFPVIQHEIEQAKWMNKLIEIRNQEMMCRERALLDSERREFWLAKAEELGQRALDEIA